MIAMNELKGLMVAKGYTQTTIAKELGISRKTLSKHLKEGVMGSDEMEKLIKILDIKNPSEIFFAHQIT